LRERIETRARRERWRKIVREFRIHERYLGQNQRTAQADFEFVLGRGQHGVACYFRACARRRGNRDERRGKLGQSAASTDDFKVIEQLAVVGQHGSDGFGGINRAAAAKGDDEVALRGASRGDALVHYLNRRLARDGKRGCGDPFRSKQHY
jgi:hypothetical protein